MSRDKGNIAEDRALEFLLKNDFSLVEKNFYSRFGEIDIIVVKDGVLHFIEVKSALDYESAIQNITHKKLSRMIKTGDIYLKKKSLDVSYMYDAVIVTPNSVELIENITI